MLLQGNTTTTTTLRPHHYLFYYSTASAVPPLHLVSSPQPFWTVRCCQAPTERREADRPEELQNKSISVCTGDSVSICPSHFTSLFMVSLLMCPVVF